MAKATQTGGSNQERKARSGYNEKNPTQPQGAFKADSMETKSPGTEKRTKGPGLKKQFSKK